MLAQARSPGGFLSASSRTCTTGSSGERIGHCRRGGFTYPSRQRPLAVAALEDKIVQRAVVALLNAIYKEDFLGISYGSGQDAARMMRWTRSVSASTAGTFVTNPREKRPQISPIFKADTVTLHVSREKDKDIALELHLVDGGWDDTKVVQPDGYPREGER